MVCLQSKPYAFGLPGPGLRKAHPYHSESLKLSSESCEPHCAFRLHPHSCLHLLTSCYLRDSYQLLLEDSSSSRRGLMSSASGELEHDSDARGRLGGLKPVHDFCVCFNVFFVYIYGLYGTTILSPSRNHIEITERAKIK